MLTIIVWGAFVPTLVELQNTLSWIVLVLGAMGLVYGFFKLAEFVIEWGAYGWASWRSRRQTLPIQTDLDRRRQLEAAVHVPHRNGFGKRREYVVNCLREPRR